MKVFISYAREDHDIAKKLRDDLQNAGIRTWLDKEDLLPGQKWRTVIRKEIRECSHFLAVLSSKSLSTRGFVQKELKMALDMLGEFPEDEIFVIPVRIEECEPEDEQLQEIHWADLFPSYEKGFRDILRVLGQKVPEPDKPVIENIQSQSPKEEEKPAQPFFDTQSKQKPKSQRSKIITAVIVVSLLLAIVISYMNSPKFVKLRNTPITVSDEEAISKFKLNEKWRPLEYVKNDFKDNGNGTITDHATGLMWQKSGSPDQKYLKDVPAYIEKLNSDKFAGYSDWRLPTVDELKSLLTPKEMNGDLYIDPIFDKTQRWCWTSDTRASGGAWGVYFRSGGVSWGYDNVLYVRAVRSRQ